MSQDSKTILYLSYDGMTDPLGQSQVLPYIIGLTKEGYQFTLLSCEKKERFIQHKDIIESICKEHNIDWQPIMYTKSPPVFSTIWDIFKLNAKAKKLHQQKQFSLFHCRSYITSLIGLGFKQKHQVKFLFDMRGFWADERVDGGLWDKTKIPFKQIYSYFKKKEQLFLSESDAVISLTERGKQEMLTWGIKKMSTSKISVIPCSSDFELFIPQDKNICKENLGIEKDTLVLSYVGSLGTWYLLDEMLNFYSMVKQKYKKNIFLILTPDDPELIYKLAEKYELEKSDFIIKFSQRIDIPKIVSASDFSVFFIKPSYSKKSSSPTKMGELLAMGIPIICNDIGDVKNIVENTQAGICIQELNKNAFASAIEQIPNLINHNKNKIREVSKEYFLLTSGIEKYTKIYQNLLNG